MLINMLASVYDVSAPVHKSGVSSSKLLPALLSINNVPLYNPTAGSNVGANLINPLKVST